MLHFLTIGIVLGFSAGFSPGPLFTLVISETLRSGLRAGVVTALAPFITDLPIICFSIFFLRQFAHSDTVLGILSLLGGAFVFYLGRENFIFRQEQPSILPDRASSFKKAVLVNAISPHPYLFWITVGGPTVLTAAKLNLAGAIAFVLSFYVLLIGSKVALALIVGRFRKFLSGRTYVTIMRVLGLMLWGLALLLFYDGLRLIRFV